ncbi:hypothetical protein BDV96DRAFT_551207, partial [Lophiotrema nucula]
MPIATSSNGTTTPAGFAGDEFSNNLLSDLAPLLTLFGEQVTKQFLSVSISWADNMLISLGPLGIVTIVVSAIRVAGSRRLRTLVGRARESRSTAETELLSSTSADVCELWNGQEVVRQYGSADTKEFILHYADSSKLEVMDLADAYGNNILVESSGKPVGYIPLSLAEGDPNLTLNIPGATASTMELWLWVMCGMVMQLFVLAFPALTTYYWKWKKAASPTARYGFPCYLLGSLAIIAGLAMCSHTINGSTTEYDFIKDPKRSTPMKIIRIQRATIVGEQHYDSYLIAEADTRPRLRVSRLNDNVYSNLAVMASCLTLAGYCCQFIGLRALHWSATIVTLGFTGLMTCVRAWARRGLATGPNCVRLCNGYELPCAALYLDFQNSIAKIKGRKPLEWTKTGVSIHIDMHPSSGRFPFADQFFPHFEVRTGAYFMAHADEIDARQMLPSAVPRCEEPASRSNPPSIHEVDHLIELQQRMPASQSNTDLARQLERALVAVMNFVTKSADLEWAEKRTPSGIFDWSIELSRSAAQPADTCQGWVRELASVICYIPIMGYRDASWELGEHEMRTIKAILQLWGFSMKARQDLLPAIDPCAEKYLRIIGHINEGHSANGLDQIAHWLPESEIYFCPRPDGSRLPNLELRQLEFLRHFKPFPVFGYVNSSLRATSGEKLNNALSPEPLTSSNCGTRKVLLKNASDKYTEIAIISNNSLEVECALELFSCFMLELASNLTSLGGTVNSSLKRSLGSHPSAAHVTVVTTYENSVVQSLVEILMDAAPELFPRAGNAQVMLVPALFQHGLLSHPGARIDAISEASSEQAVAPTC